ncbi:MAG TPA: rhomboid family intramembrane serine protease [Myxococcota bacterium]|nr:rhomboid family intramembrane serine protease [Myxococcota bacterium]
MTDPGSGDASRIAAGTRREAESWSLVLAADGIAHRVFAAQGQWCLELSAADHARAEAAIAGWERERAERAAAPAPQPVPEVVTHAGVWLGLALLGFHAWTGPWQEGNAWFERGAANARLIVEGELWRTVTALTLHSDVTHAIGNAFSCAVFGGLLMRRYGAGLGALLLLLSGALGNWLTAEWQRAHYVSVGASTALFGAIGALAATELVRRRRLRLRWDRAWLPLAGGIGLLAMLGTGRGSDLTAHVLGLVSGVALGVPVALRVTQPPRPLVQAALASLALLAVALCWADAR